MGISLERVRDIRLLWNSDPWGSSHIDLNALENRRPPHGHVIAVRITAENPEEGYVISRYEKESSSLGKNASIAHIESYMRLPVPG